MGEPSIRWQWATKGALIGGAFATLQLVSSGEPYLASAEWMARGAGGMTAGVLMGGMLGMALGVRREWSRRNAPILPQSDTLQPQDASSEGVVARLGNVLYWAGCGFAVLFFVAGWWMASMVVPPGDQALFGGGGSVAAAVSWLLGRASRYVLAGR